MLQPSSPEAKSVPVRRRLAGGVTGHWKQILFTVAVLVGIFALYQWFQPARPFTTATVVRGDISATVSANARVRATRTARLSFQFSGLLSEVFVHQGDEVKSGQVLAKLKSDDLDRRVSQSELALASRMIDLQRAQAAPRAQDLDIAQGNVKKAAIALAAAQDNAKKNPSSSSDAAREIAQADYDSARAGFDRLTAGPTGLDLQQLKNNVASAQIDLDTARAQQAQSQIIAPYDAVVTDVNDQPGEMVGGFTPVFSIADLTHLELLAEIDEIDVGAVAAGQTVDVRFDAFPAEILHGKLITLYPAASDVRGALVYNARVSFDTGKLGIRPGMGATLKIATIEKKGVLLVPSRAVRNAGSQKIVTVAFNGGPQNLVVQTGVTDGSSIEIISGLEQGQQVVIE